MLQEMDQYAMHVRNDHCHKVTFCENFEVCLFDQFVPNIGKVFTKYVKISVEESLNG